MTISSVDIADNPKAVLMTQIIQSLSNRKNDSCLLIEMDRPYNLYMLDMQARLYLEAIKDEPFVRQLYGPFVKAVKDNLNSIFGNLPEKIDFIDLGPGYPDKSALLVKYLKDNSINLRYIPVDISKYFLGVTVEYFKEWNIEIIPLNILFEELPQELNKSKYKNGQRVQIINIGFTFNNFAPASILSLLGDLIKDSAVVIIATQTVEEKNIAESIEPYKSEKADKFNFKMLEIVGFKRGDFNYVVNYRNNRIEMGYEAKNDIRIGNSLYIKPGDIILTSFSYRYDKETLLNYLKKYFSEVNVIRDTATRICIASMKEKIQ